VIQAVGLHRQGQVHLGQQVVFRDGDDNIRAFQLQSRLLHSGRWRSASSMQSIVS